MPWKNSFKDSNHSKITVYAFSIVNNVTPQTQLGSVRHLQTIQFTNHVSKYTWNSKTPNGLA